jgi:hypothetical protein
MTFLVRLKYKYNRLVKITGLINYRFHTMSKFRCKLKKLSL